MLKKLLLGLGALFFILMGSLILIMGYVFNNPDSVFTAFHSMTEKILQGQKYEEKAEFFLQGMDRIVINSNGVDLHVRTYSERTMKILLQGKVPRFENGPFIIQSADQNELHVQIHEPVASNWVQMNVNGQVTTQESDARLVAEIYLPESYKKHVELETRSGRVELQLPEHILYELDLQSVSGAVTNNLKQVTTGEIQPQDVGHIKVQTTEGPISVEPLK